MDNVVNELSVNIFNFKMKLTCIYKWQFIGYYFGSMTQLMLEVTLHRAKKILSENNASNTFFEPRCEKTGLRGFRPGPTQTGLCTHRR